MSVYDRIAGIYDPWSRSVVEDVGFYVAAARKAGGPVVELGIGTGRIAIPTAAAGVPVIGVDSSVEMLALCRRKAETAGVLGLLDLRLGDLRSPPVTELAPLATCPFRAFLHLANDSERLEALAAVHDLLLPGGRFVFDVFAPSLDDVDETHGLWLEREPGIWERADWNLEERTLLLAIRADSEEITMQLSWLSHVEWELLLRRAGFEIDACYGWFDLRPFAGEEDMVWIARRRG